MPKRFDDSVRGVYSTGTPQPVAPDQLTLEWFREQAALHEKTLRRQYEHGDTPFPAEWEEALAQFDPATPTGALRRWAYVKHLLWVRDENLHARGGDADRQKQLAAYQLITREPVPVTLESGRLVHVTDRSLAALVEIGRHGTAMASIVGDIDRADELIADLAAALDGSDDPTRRRTLRRRLQWVRDVKVRALAELSKHRQAIYAHVFTESGAPADDLDDAPDWWDEITGDDERRLIDAVNEAGPERTKQVGPMPKPPARKDSSGRLRYLESFGFLSPLARWGITVPIDAAGWYDRPLGQALMFMRAGAEPVWEEKRG